MDMSQEEDELGKTIQQHRRSNGITLREVARKTGLPKGCLSKIEKSRKALPVSTLINIAKALSITISEMFREAEENSSICLVQKWERRTMGRDGAVFGYAYQTLAHKFHNKHMDPYFLTLPLIPRKNASFSTRVKNYYLCLRGQ